MQGALEEAFRAHAWSTRRLLDFCRALDSDQLAAVNDATRWSIPQTLTHLVSADGYYVSSLTGTARPVPAWNEDTDPPWELDVLSERADCLPELWSAYLATNDDADRVVVIDGGTFECRAGVIVAHALHHGDLHREQVCSILRGVGVEPPDLQPWEYAEATGRARAIDPA